MSKAEWKDIVNQSSKEALSYPDDLFEDVTGRKKPKTASEKKAFIDEEWETFVRHNPNL